MKRALKLLGALVAFILLVVAGAYFTGTLASAVVAIFKPHHGWDLALKAPAPDYAKAEAWAALPSKDSPAKLVPKGVAASPASPAVDVFFIHPTGYMHGADWNSPLDPNSQTGENTKWMMANQAAAFNGCCAVYAPRYREASIFRYVASPPDDVARKTMDLAYSDVDRAFTYFLEHYSKGRPFILASHSQGTHHALTLIKNRIDGTPLAARMVAAYVIGGGITDDDVAKLKTVHACASATDLHCIVHWATFGEGANTDQEHDDGKLLCVNPLTWKRDGARAPASEHKGGVPQSGRFQIALWGSDRAQGILFDALSAPVPHQTWAECRKGLLFVADQSGGPFDGLDLGGKNYHGLDYPLFAIDIRENAATRVAAYLAAAK